MSFRNCKIVGRSVDPEVYHRIDIERGSPDYPISPSTLKEIARCPHRWRAGYVSPDTKAKEWGNLLDTQLLTPERFEARYVLQPETYPAPATHASVKKGLIEAGSPLPWNGNATYCDNWLQEQAAKDLQPVSAKQWLSLADATKRFAADEVLKDFLEASDRQVMVVGEWVDEGTKLVIPVRCLIDLVPWHESEWGLKSLGDLKTTRSASPFAFKRFCYDMGYHVQAAFDLDLYNAATGEQRCQWCFLLQENFAPWETSKCFLSQEFEQIGRSSYRESLALYARCLKTGKWNGYDDHDEASQGWSCLQADPWMESASMFAPKPDFEEEEAPEVSEMPS